ncbi:multiple sugar transport system substrate-binding protein/raffinose/stachyose/melibiose transport system substrate-binding protein [Salinibacterium sp. CAN_S4]|uniref:extracellular solute-binding protein n=1 Tax=Salinibacterium sp. CAN_S4 TaxID=2787727 RepID=UPI0018EFB635
MKAKRLLTAGAIVAAGALVLSGCSADAEGSDDGSVSMTFWQNSTTGAGQAYWVDTIAAFEAENPGVTIEMQSIQNEEMDGKLQTALNSGDAPDIFMARGGGKLADVVAAGQAKDLTDLLSDETKTALGGVISAFEVDGKNYGLATAVLPSGIYYTQDLFDQAGITEAPTTMDELEAANDQLKDAGIEPIALGAKDAWPAAHWYYNFALRACSQDVINQAAADRAFDDDCWLEAGEELAAFNETEPFNTGFLTTAAQQGAGSSAGLVANKIAAMELMGAWNPGVITDLTPDQQPLADLRWFPFPAVDGGDGDPAAMMGGVDGFSCHVEAPDACVDFLDFIATQENQEAYAVAFQTLPASQDAQGVVEDPALQEVLTAYNAAPYVSVWLDTLFGQNVGNALNVAVVDLLAGQGSAEDIVTAVNDAAARS